MSATTVNNNHAAIRLAASTLWLHHLRNATRELGNEPRRRYTRELANAVLQSNLPLIADSVMRLVVNGGESLHIANQIAGTLMQIADTARTGIGDAQRSQLHILRNRRIGTLTMDGILDLTFPRGFDEFVKIAAASTDFGIENISPKELIQHLNRSTAAELEGSGPHDPGEGIRFAAGNGHYWAAVLVAPIENRGKGPEIRSKLSVADQMAYTEWLRTHARELDPAEAMEAMMTGK